MIFVILGLFQACFGINVDTPVDGSDWFEQNTRMVSAFVLKIGILRTER